MSQKVFNIMFSAAIAILGISNYYLKSKVEEIKPPDIRMVHIVNEKQPDFFSKSPQEGLMEALEYYGVKYPQIVYVQAILESGLGESSLYKRTNNLFGLYNSKEGEYYSYDHWTACIVDYRDKIQSRLKEGEDYYKFLKRIRYAEDKEYINKLKRINPP